MIAFHSCWAGRIDAGTGNHNVTIHANVICFLKVLLEADTLMLMYEPAQSFERFFFWN